MAYEQQGWADGDMIWLEGADGRLGQYMYSPAGLIPITQIDTRNELGFGSLQTVILQDQAKQAEEAARAQAAQEAARRQAEEQAARAAAEEAARRQAEEAARRQAEEAARRQAEIIARQQAASAAPPVNAQEVLNQAPTPSGPAFQATPIPQATAPAPFPTVPAPPKPTPFQAGIFQGLTPGSIPPAEIMGVPIPQPANFNIYDPKTGGRPTGALPAVNFFSSLVQTPTPFTNVDPFAPTMGTVQAPAGQTVAFQPTALQYSTVPNIFALRPLGGLV